jgi:hypothetical protein
MKKTLLAFFCLFATAGLPACAGAEIDNNLSDGVFKISTNPVFFFLPGFCTGGDSVLLHARLGYEVEMDNSSSIGAHLGFETTFGGIIDTYSYTGEIFYYPFNRIRYTEIYPFFSAGYAMIRDFKRNYFPRDLRQRGGGQIGTGIYYGTPARIFLHVFYRHASFRVYPAEDEIWALDRDIDLSAIFFEWGLVWTF